jgi:hypothetical protein
MVSKEVAPDTGDVGEFGDGQIARRQIVDYQETSGISQGRVRRCTVFQSHNSKYIDSITIVSIFSG